MAAASDPIAHELAELVYREARLIDEKRFEEWYELFTDDARYWMPLTRGQAEGESHTSLFYEDKLLLKVRITRLRSSNAFSQQQPSFCLHVLQQPHVEEMDLDANRFIVRTPFVYVEAQLDRQLILAGVAWHHIALVDAALRIRLKKIDLLNCDAALPSIQLFL